MSNNLTINYKEFGGRLRAIYYIRSVHAQLNETSGYIASPGYPVSYRHSTLYSWQISVRTGLVIYLNISVDIENNFDMIKIYEAEVASPAAYLMNITGNVTKENIVSNSNEMLIQFDTDGIKSEKGFNASYVSYVRYGYPCNATVKCDMTLTCNMTICGCKTNEYYDQQSRSCNYKRQHSALCNFTDMCVEKFVCYKGRCDCIHTHYYYSIFGYCTIRAGYGNSCSYSVPCAEEFECRNAKCLCKESQYYDSPKCKDRLPYNYKCNYSSQCLQNCECINNVCGCSSRQYYEQEDETCRDKRWPVQYETIIKEINPNKTLLITTIVSVLICIVSAIIIGILCSKYMKLTKRLKHSREVKENVNATLETSQRKNVPITTNIATDKKECTLIPIANENTIRTNTKTNHQHLPAIPEGTVPNKTCPIASESQRTEAQNIKQPTTEGNLNIVNPSVNSFNCFTRMYGGHLSLHNTSICRSQQLNLENLNDSLSPEIERQLRNVNPSVTC